jgi:beta-lactam-binding protein with PASTA domain
MNVEVLPMPKFLTGFTKFFIFCCFLVALAGFSGIVTVRYIFATGEVEVPDLVGKNVVYAVDLLAERHLELKRVDQQFDAKIPKDHILIQDPPPGTKSKKNRTVRVVLSKGAESVPIPDVIGKRWQEAIRTLQQNKFRTGNVAYVHSAEVPVDCIVAQTPSPRSEASAGGRVDLLVSLGTYKNVMVMPDLVEERLAYALQVIGKLGLVLGKVEHEQYPGVPPNIVLSQVPKPGTLVEEQNIVTFVVSGEAGGTDTMEGSSSSVQYESLEYTVPPGRFDREVTVLVKNAEGVSEMYRQFVPPGNRIVVRVPVVGETVAEVYLDGVLDHVIRF